MLQTEQSVPPADLRADRQDHSQKNIVRKLLGTDSGQVEQPLKPQKKIPLIVQQTLMAMVAASPTKYDGLKLHPTRKDWWAIGRLAAYNYDHRGFPLLHQHEIRILQKWGYLYGKYINCPELGAYIDAYRKYCLSSMKQDG